jgi:uncharacterized protein (DUF1697 family)
MSAEPNEMPWLNCAACSLTSATKMYAHSGNVLFRCARSNTGKLALSIQNAIADTASVTVITATDFAAIVRDNPLPYIAVDPAKHLVAFVAHPRSLDPLRSLMEEAWAPDALAIGSQAAYL